MLFQAALDALVNGKFVTRNGWEAGRYLALLPHMPSIWMCATIPNPAAGNWQPLVQDLVADDWSLLGEATPKSEAPVPPAPQGDAPQGDVPPAA